MSGLSTRTSDIGDVRSPIQPRAVWDLDVSLIHSPQIEFKIFTFRFVNNNHGISNVPFARHQQHHEFCTVCFARGFPRERVFVSVEHVEIKVLFGLDRSAEDHTNWRSHYVQLPSINWSSIPKRWEVASSVITQPPVVISSRPSSRSFFTVCFFVGWALQHKQNGDERETRQKKNFDETGPHTRRHDRTTTETFAKVSGTAFPLIFSGVKIEWEGVWEWRRGKIRATRFFVIEGNRFIAKVGFITQVKSNKFKSHYSNRIAFYSIMVLFKGDIDMIN